VTDGALWINDGILLGTGILVWRYVAATNRLVRTSQQQLRAAVKQIESQHTPALTMRIQGTTIWLINIGSGPAIYVELSRIAANAAPDFNLGSNEPGRIFSYVEAHNHVDTRIDSTWLSRLEPNLHCRYRSLSGTTYVSVVNPKGGDVVDVRFYQQTRDS
jgi:hypothetical protein